MMENSQSHNSSLKEKVGSLALPVHLELCPLSLGDPTTKNIRSLHLLCKNEHQCVYWCVSTSSGCFFLLAMNLSLPGIHGQMSFHRKVRGLWSKKDYKAWKLSAENGNWKIANLKKDVEVRKPLISTSLGDWRRKDMEADGKSSSVARILNFKFSPQKIYVFIEF